MSIKAKALPQHIIDKMDPKDRARLGVKTAAERTDAVTAKSEAAIQSAVEAYCVQLGFEKLSAENIQRSEVRKGFPRSGWQFHLSPLGAKKNPILPDITLFSNDGRFLWLELKAKGGKVRPLQRVLIACGFWKVAFTAEDACKMVNEWFSGGDQVLAQSVRVRAHYQRG